MAREYVPIFFDWVEVTEELNDQEKGRLIDAIVLYAQGGDWQDRIKGNERYLFPAFKKQIDRANEASENKSQAAVEREQKKAQKAQESTKSTSEHKFPNNNNNKEDNNKENNNINRGRRFTPPTLDEVAEYCESRKNGIDAQCFIDFYESKGWMVGKSPMKNWQAAIRHWEVGNRQQHSLGYDLPL